MKFSNFLGINNRKPDFALRVATSTLNGQYLRTADNVDVTNPGNLRRRNGTALHQAMTDAHSLYADSFLVRDAVLYAITLPTYSETLLKVLTDNGPMNYVSFGADTYYSNGVDSGRIAAGVVYPLGLPTPDIPVVASIGGSLEVGWYQVALSYSNSATGEEGGLSNFAKYERTSLGGIRVTLPAAVAGATHINVYLSAANGELPYLLATVATGTATYDCISLPTGREASVRDEAPLPAGRLFLSNGRLCSIVGNTVYVGLPFRPGYYLPTEGYIPFPANVSIAVENQGGTYIAADKTYWFPGDLGDVQGPLADVLPYGAVPGTAFMLPDRSACGWFGAKGLVIGSTNGEVEAVMTENIDLTAPVSGQSIVFESDGYRRVVSCGWCVNLENKAATTYSDWDFTSVSGSYGTKTDGIYLLNSQGLVDASIGFGK